MNNHSITTIERFITSNISSGSPGCVAGVLQHGETVYAKGFGRANLEYPSPISAETVFDIGSMAKQFVGMAVALLEEEGRIDTTAGIRDYLPDLPDYTHRIKVANLLHHTSGIRNYTVLAYYMIGYHESDAISPEEVYDLLKSVQTGSFAPGERYEYSDSNYFLLGKIVEQVSGKTLGEFAAENIFQPLGMENTLFRECHSRVIPNRAISYVQHPVRFQSPAVYRQFADPSETDYSLSSPYEHVGAEGLWTTLNDLMIWDRNFTCNRLGIGKQELIDHILTPGRIRINERIGYGYGINVGTHKGETFFGHDGAIHGYTSSILHFPGRDTAILCLTNQNRFPAWTIRDRIMDVLFPLSNAKPAKQEKQKKQVAFSDAGHIQGSYQNAATADIWEIQIKDGEIVVEVNRGWTFKLEQVGPNTFRGTDPGEVLLLNLIHDDGGVVRQLRVTGEKEISVLEAFLSSGLTQAELQQYEGTYHCTELNTTFLVQVKEEGLWLRNQNRHFCSMDLVYSPTIKDHFTAYDPHPVCSQITFYRQFDQINAFAYRDYDGDGREALRFIKE